MTGLRGVAALWVCLFHYTVNGKPPGTLALQVAHTGYLGLIIFFVLSGFILAHVYQGWFQKIDLGSYTRFMMLRVARVYPLHLLTLLIVAIFFAAGITTIKATDTAATFVMNLLLVQAWGFTNDMSWNDPSWSISSEFFCYLIFPVILWLLHNTKWKTAAIIILSSAYLVAFKAYCSFIYSFVDVATIRFSYSISLLNFVQIFMTGVASYYIASSIKSIGSAAFSAIALSGVAWLLYIGATSGNAVPAQYASAVAIIGLSRDNGFSILFRNTVAKFFGDISYALYLIHLPLVFLWIKFIETPFHSIPLTLRLIAAVGAATFLHYAFELPARRYLRRRALNDVGPRVLSSRHANVHAAHL